PGQRHQEELGWLLFGDLPGERQPLPARADARREILVVVLRQLHRRDTLLFVGAFIEPFEEANVAAVTRWLIVFVGAGLLFGLDYRRDHRDNAAPIGRELRV